MRFVRALPWGGGAVQREWMSKTKAEYDPEFVAMMRIILVTGALAVLLWLLNHLV